MPQSIESVARLGQYLEGVLGRADHHAGNVDQICLAIAGAVIWRATADPEVHAREGEMKNVLWFQVGSRRFAISYNHSEGQIELRERTTHGQTIAAFNNATPLADIKRVFQSL